MIFKNGGFALILCGCLMLVSFTSAKNVGPQRALERVRRNGPKDNVQEQIVSKKETVDAVEEQEERGADADEELEEELEELEEELEEEEEEEELIDELYQTGNIGDLVDDPLYGAIDDDNEDDAGYFVYEDEGDDGDDDADSDDWDDDADSDDWDDVEDEEEAEDGEGFWDTMLGLLNPDPSWEQEIQEEWDEAQAADAEAAGADDFAYGNPFDTDGRGNEDIDTTDNADTGGSMSATVVKNDAPGHQLLKKKRKRRNVHEKPASITAEKNVMKPLKRIKRMM